MDKIIMEEELPIRMVAFGHCFRAESGSAGMCLSSVLKLRDEDSLQSDYVSLLWLADLLTFLDNGRVSAGSASKGLYRVHQFSKVEMFTLGTEEQSDHLLAELCHIEEEIFTELGLHYQMLVFSRPGQAILTLLTSYSSSQ